MRLGQASPPGLGPVEYAERQWRQHKADAGAREGGEQAVQHAICRPRSRVSSHGRALRPGIINMPRVHCHWQASWCCLAVLSRKHEPGADRRQHSKRGSQNGMAMARKNKKPTARMGVSPCRPGGKGEGLHMHCKGTTELLESVRRQQGKQCIPGKMRDGSRM